MKLICNKCGGKKFKDVEHLTYTVDPPIHCTIYKCEKCGSKNIWCRVIDYTC